MLDAPAIEALRASDAVIADARVVLEQALTARNRLILEHLAAGDPITHVARYAGIGTAQLYRVLAPAYAVTG
jgi:DNA-binding phage protein